MVIQDLQSHKIGWKFVFFPPSAFLMEGETMIRACARWRRHLIQKLVTGYLNAFGNTRCEIYSKCRRAVFQYFYVVRTRMLPNLFDK
jgi:hypothetical protein